MEEKIKASAHPDYGTYTIISIILPIIGIILGIVMFTKDKPADKKLGEHTLALSILFLIVWSIAWGLYVSSKSAVYYP